jgi:hypothetical protein
MAGVHIHALFYLYIYYLTANVTVIVELLCRTQESNMAVARKLRCASGLLITVDVHVIFEVISCK